MTKLTMFFALVMIAVGVVLHDPRYRGKIPFHDSFGTLFAAVGVGVMMLTLLYEILTGSW